MFPVIVSHDGRVLSDTKEEPAPPPEVEETPLHVLAAREAAKQSTKKHH